MQQPKKNKPASLFDTPLQSDAIKQHTVENDYDKDLLPGINQEEVRARHQGIAAEFGNGLTRAALKIPGNVISNTAAILDIEDYNNQDLEVGNWLTNFIQDKINPVIDEEFKVYRENPNKTFDLGSSEWWADNGTSLVGSAAEFAITGSLIAHALAPLAATGVGSLAVTGITALALNQAEAITSAREVYKNAYDINVSKYGDLEAKRMAADAAAYTININRINIPLNLTSAKLFLKTPKVTRQLVAEMGKKQLLKKLAGEGAQEFGEEVVNYVGEQEGGRRGRGEKYSVANTIRDVLSDEGLEAGFLGFLGGVAQTGFTEGINELKGQNEEERSRYKTQQDLLKGYEDLRSTVTGQASAAKIIESAKVNASLINKVYEAEVANNDGLAQSLRNELLQYQALTAFENGTTQQLVDTYKALGTDSEFTKQHSEAAKQAVLAVQKIEKWEKLYETSLSRFPKDRVTPYLNNVIEKEAIISKASDLFLKKNEIEKKIATNTSLGLSSVQEEQELAAIVAEREALDVSINQNIIDAAYIASEEFDPTEYRKQKIASITGEKVEDEEVVLGEGESIIDTKSDDKGRTDTYKASVSEKEGIKYTKFSFNSSKHKSKNSWNEASVPLDKTEYKDYEADLDHIEDAADYDIKVREIREKDGKVAATVDLIHKTDKDLTQRKQEVELRKKTGKDNGKQNTTTTGKGANTSNVPTPTTGRESTTVSKGEPFNLLDIEEEGQEFIFEGSTKDIHFNYDGDKIEALGVYDKDGNLLTDAASLGQAKVVGDNLMNLKGQGKNHQKPMYKVVKGEAKKVIIKKDVPLPPQPPISEGKFEADPFDESSFKGWNIFKTSSNTYDGKKATPEEKRWQEFLDQDRRSVSEFLLKVVTHHDKKADGKFLIDDYYDTKNIKHVADKVEELKKKDKGVRTEEEYQSEARTGILIILTDKAGNPISDKEGILKTRLQVKHNYDHDGSPVISLKHFAKRNGLGYIDGDLESQTPELKAAWKKHHDAHNAFREKLLTGEIKYLKPVSKGRGVPVMSEGYSSLEDTILDDVNNPSKDNVVFHIPTAGEVDKNGNVSNYEEYGKTGDKLRVGSLYAIVDEVPIQLKPRALSPEEVQHILSLYSKIGELHKAELTDDSKKKINELDKEIDLYIFKTNDETATRDAYHLRRDYKKVYYGVNGEADLSDIANNKEFAAFLSTKNRQVDKNLLEANDLMGKQTYREFLFKGSNPAFTTNYPKKGTIQRMNKYLVYDPNATPKPLVASTPSPEGDTLTDPNKPAGRRGAKKNIGDIKGGLKRKITGADNYTVEDLAAMKKWYQDRFDGESFKVVKELIDGDAFGQFYNGLVTLYEKAEIGTGYHEAFHKVTQQYLTDTQIDSLYNEYRGSVKRGSKLSDLEVEEALAEDFRQYMLSGQKRILGKPVRNSLFRKLYNLIKNFFSGKADIQSVYEKLASKKGYSGRKKVNMNQFAKLNAIKNKEGKVLFNEIKTKEVFDSLSKRLLDTLYSFDITPAQLSASDKVPIIIGETRHTLTSLTDGAYAEVLKDLYRRYNELYDDESVSQDVLDDIDTITSDYSAIVEQHKVYMTSLGMKISNKESDEGVVEEPVDENNEAATEASEGKDVGRDGRDYTPINEINTVNTLSNNSKLLIASLTDVDVNLEPKTNSLLEQKLVDFNSVTKLLLWNLKGLTTAEAIDSKLKELESKYGWAVELRQKLGDVTNTDIDYSKYSQWIDFVGDFSKNYSEGTITMIKAEDGTIYQISSNEENMKMRIRDRWRAKLAGSPYSKEVNGQITLTNAIGDLKGVEFLEGIGMDFDGYTPEELFPSLITPSTINHLKTFLIGKINSGEVVNDLGALSKEEGSINRLLDIAVRRTEETIELSYKNAEGKTIYAISQNNFFSKVVNIVNQSTTKKDLISKLPHLDSIYNQDSLWMSQLFDKDGNKIKGAKLVFNTVSGVKLSEDERTGINTTNLHPADKMMQEISDVLNWGIASTPRIADASTEYASGIKADKKGNILIPIEDVKKGYNIPIVNDYFTKRFASELDRIRSFKVDGIGKDIGYYGAKQLDKDKNPIEGSEPAANWSLFDEILSAGTKEALVPYMSNYDTVTPELMGAVLDDLYKFLDKLEGENWSNMSKFGMTTKSEEGLKEVYVNGKKTVQPVKGRHLGIDSELTDKHDIKDISKAFTINHFIQTIEHSMFYMGDPALYKDPFKRYKAYAGTKDFCTTGDFANGWINKNKPSRMKEVGDTFKAVVREDVTSKVAKEQWEEYVYAVESTGKSREEAEKILGEYQNMTEADAQAYATLDAYRVIKIKSKNWSPLEESQYWYEVALETYKKSGIGVVDSAYIKEDQKGNKSFDYSKNPGGVFVTIKAQYAGPQKYTKTNSKGKSINPQTFHKYSIMPLYGSLVEGTSMQAKYDSMIDNGVSYEVFSSGVKVGALTDSNGKLPDFYSETGESNVIDSSTPIQVLPYEWMGIQVYMAPKAKKENTWGTQKRKLIWANIFEDGTTTFPGFEELHKEYIEKIGQLVDSSWEKLKKDLAIEENPDGTYKYVNFEKLAKLIRKESVDRQLADNLIDSIQTEIGPDGKSKVLKYPIDSLVNRPKIEALLLSLVNSRVISHKVAGDAMPQAASTGFESVNYKRLKDPVTGKYPPNELLSYRLSKDGKTVLPIQVKVPANAQYDVLLKKYGSVAALNAAIKEPGFDKRLITMIGYRIPTQGLNSIEHMEIVEFLDPAVANTIILPTHIVAKSGGDFDIDKLNVFRPNFKLVDPNQTLSSYVNKKLKAYKEAGTTYKFKDNYTDEELEIIYEEVDEVGEESAEGVISKLVETYDTTIAGKPLKDTKIVYTDSTRSSKAGIQNRIIEISKAILEHPDNFAQLITPNTTATLTGLVDDIRKASGRDKSKTTKTSVFKFSNILDQFTYFLGGKSNVGIAAIHNTFHTIFQEAGTTLSAKKTVEVGKKLVEVPRIYLDSNVTGDKISLGGQKDKGNNLISDIISQFLNAYVDVAKDPFYKDLNAGKETASVYFYLIHAGVDIKSIAYFMNQPIILEYINEISLNKSLIKKGTSTPNWMIKEALAAKYAQALDGLKGFKPLGVEKYKEYSSADNTKLLEWTGKKLSKVTEDDIEFLQAQIQFLDNYMSYKEDADGLTELMRSLNADTNKSISLAAIGDRLELQNTVDSKFEGVREKIESSTIIGKFNKLAKIEKMYEPLFITQKEFKAVRRRLLDVTLGLTKTDERDKVSRLLDNDFINYLTQRFGGLSSEIDTLFKGSNSLPMQLIDIKKLPEVQDNPLIKQLQSVLNNIEGEIDNISIYARKLTTYESNVLTSSWRELYEDANPKVQQFARDLNKFIILQSGLNNSPITFLGLEPYEEYGDITKSAIDAYTASITDPRTGKVMKREVDQVMNDFVSRFFLKNVDNTLVVPFYKGTIDGQGYPIAVKPLRHRSVLQVKQDDKIILVNAHRQQLTWTKDINIVKTGYKLQNFYLNDNPGFMTGRNWAGEPVDTERKTSNKDVSPPKSPSDFTNHTGGAEGSDTIWDEVGREYGVTKHNHYREPGATQLDSKRLRDAGVAPVNISQEDYNEGIAKATQAARDMYGLKGTIRKEYIIRNWAQVKYSDAVYALGTILKPGDRLSASTKKSDDRIALVEQVKGGTGYAVQMAINEGKPVYVFDGTKGSWFKWDGKTFVKVGTPILTKNFAGIGSRSLSTEKVWEDSIQAVRDVYEKTIEGINNQKKQGGIPPTDGQDATTVEQAILQGIKNGESLFDLSTRLDMAIESIEPIYAVLKEYYLENKGNIDALDRGDYDNLGETKPTTTTKVEGKTTVVPKGSKNTNLPIFEDENNVYLMNDGQQEAYNFIKGQVKDIINRKESFHIEDFSNTVSFEDGLSKQFSGVIPQFMWDRMIGLAGRGGTGKTTVIKKIIEDVQKENGSKYTGLSVHYLAPTHTAATVLQESLKIDSESTGGIVSTISSMVRRRGPQEGSIKEPSEKLWLISPEDYIKSLVFSPGVGYNDIIIVDESSMVTKKNIKDILFRLQNEYDSKNKDEDGNYREDRVPMRMPIFIFMGDYRQLGPIGESAPGSLVNKGIISSTLLLNEGKASELTQVMRSKDEILHKIYDSIGNQIITNIEKVQNGEQPVKLNFNEYDRLTSKSSENILVLNRSSIDGVIDDYTKYLSENNNPYGMFWIHYNNIDHANSKALFTKIRNAYFNKMGNSGQITKEDLVESPIRNYYKGDYVEYTGSLEINTHHIPSVEKDYEGKKKNIDKDVEGAYIIKKGQIKPNARFKVLDIILKKQSLWKLVPELKHDLPDIFLDTEVTVLYNRQDKVRAISVPNDVRLIEEYNKDTRLMNLRFIKESTGEVLGEADVKYGKYKDIQDKLSIFTKKYLITKMFEPSYIGSSHTAQGNSIKNVIVGDYNIKENLSKGVNQDDIFSSMYTALTRTSSKLVIIKDSEITNNQDVFTGFTDDSNTSKEPNPSKPVVEPESTVDENPFFDDKEISKNVVKDLLKEGKTIEQIVNLGLHNDLTMEELLALTSPKDSSSNDSKEDSSTQDDINHCLS